MAGAIEGSTSKAAAKRAIRSLVDFGGKTRLGRYVLRQMLDSAMAEVTHASHHGLALRFAAPNDLCDWRARTLASKEPETLDWIDAMPDSAVLWDVGANVGLYSVYAAKKRNCQVWAFEPSVFNLELLARNIHLNGVTDRVCVLPFPLSDGLGVSAMRLTTTEWGGALSTFGKQFGWDGEGIKDIFEYQMLGLTMDDAVQRLAIPSPHFLKMDVDGLEHFILKGGAAVLASVGQVLIEVNDSFREQAEECHTLLSRAGLVLREKRQSAMIAAAEGFQNCFNQIWVR